MTTQAKINDAHDILTLLDPTLLDEGAGIALAAAIAHLAAGGLEGCEQAQQAIDLGNLAEDAIDAAAKITALDAHTRSRTWAADRVVSVVLARAKIPVPVAKLMPKLASVAEDCYKHHLAEAARCESCLRPAPRRSPEHCGLCYSVCDGAASLSLQAVDDGELFARMHASTLGAHTDRWAAVDIRPDEALWLARSLLLIANPSADELTDILDDLKTHQREQGGDS